MLTHTIDLLPHLKFDGVNVYEVQPYQIWEMTLDDGEVVKVVRIESHLSSTDKWYAYTVIVKNKDNYTLRIKTSQVVNVEAFSIVPLILMTS